MQSFRRVALVLFGLIDLVRAVADFVLTAPETNTSQPKERGAWELRASEKGSSNHWKRPNDQRCDSDAHLGRRRRTHRKREGERGKLSDTERRKRDTKRE